MKVLLLVIVVSASCCRQIDGTAACDYYFDPFEGKLFAGVSLYQCRQFCSDSENFRCESFMYNSIGRDCILSDKKRASPPPTSGYNNYQYFERSADCNPVNLIDRITSCSASSDYSADWTCEGIYNGYEEYRTNPGNWAVEAEKGVGEWIQVNLNNSYMLTSVEILPRCNRSDQFNALNVHLGQGKVIPATRKCGGTASAGDCSGPDNGWFPINFPEPIRTTYVKFELTGVCPNQYAVGFREIKLLGF